MRQRWALDLGAPIVAMPALTRDESGEPLVVVGDHAGRLVAVRPSGPQAGSIARSWSLGGQVWSGGAVDDQGIVYVGADDDTLYAIDPKAAAFVWTLRLGSCESPRAPGPEGSRCDLDGGPTIGPSGDIYIGGEGVFRVDPRGNVVWRWPSTPGPHEHVSSTPLVLPDGRVYIGTQAGRIVALGDDGKTRWAYEVESDVDGALVATRSGFVCGGADDGKVYCLDDHGRVRWSFRGQRDFRGALGHVVAGGSEWILAASYDGSVYALSGHGLLRWHVRTQGAFHAMPVVDNGYHVYLGGRDGLFYVIDGRRGKIRSRYRVGVQVDAPALVLDDGTIVVGADDGVLRALR